MSESQIAQHASSSSVPLSRLPRKPKLNFKGQCNCIIFSKQLERALRVLELGWMVRQIMICMLLPCLARMSSKRRVKVRSLRNLSFLPLSPISHLYLSHIEFLRPSLKLNLESFLIFLKSCMWKLLLLMLLSQMPMYAKFLKEVLSKERKIGEHKTIVLG